jgi:glutathione S-transferase
MRAHWMLHELDLEYEARLIGSRTGETQQAEFQQLNPKGKIPVLIHGDFVLSESAAIVTYLGDRFDERTGDERLVPEPRTLERARYDEWLSFIQMELDAHTLYVIRRHEDLASLYGAAPGVVAEARRGFEQQLLAATSLLKDQAYLMGAHFNAADLMLTTCLDWAHAYGLALPDYLAEYRGRTNLRPAYRAAAKLNFSISPGA